MASTLKVKPITVSERIGNALPYGVFGLLMFGPLAFGAVEAWSIFVMEAGAVLLLFLWSAKQYLDGEIRFRPNALYLPMTVFGALVLLQVIFHVSAYQHDTVDGLLLFCAYGILCFLAGQSLFRGSQARLMAGVLSIYGFVVACFALIQGIAPNGKLYWLRQPRMGGWIYGPYVNHNHYAGLMEMLLPIPLVLALGRMAHDKERYTAAAAAAIMAGTILLSGSRGGMLALLVEVGLLGLIVLRQRTSSRVAWIGGTFLAIVLALSIWLGGSALGHRVFSPTATERSEISNDLRWGINRDGIKMFLHRPVFGWGLGTFPVVYPQFRTFYTNFFVNEAHNDYLQLLVETGVLGFGVMVWFVVLLYRKAWRKIGNWSTDMSGAVALACVLACTGILVHSTLDFNLQIPANAAFFYVLCTMGAAEPFLQPKRNRREIKRPAEQTLPASEVV